MKGCLHKNIDKLYIISSSEEIIGTVKAVHGCIPVCLYIHICVHTGIQPCIYQSIETRHIKCFSNTVAVTESICQPILSVLPSEGTEDERKLSHKERSHLEHQTMLFVVRVWGGKPHRLMKKQKERDKSHTFTSLKETATYREVHQGHSPNVLKPHPNLHRG